MNTSTRMRLAELPQFEPSPDLWERIVAAQAARQRRRHLRAALGVAAAAMLALVVLWRLPGASVDTGSQQLAALQRQSQTLERQLVALAPANRPESVATEAELVHVDRTLQLAYDRGADKQELASLWRRRIDLLDVLVAMRRQDVMVSSI